MSFVRSPDKTLRKGKVINVFVGYVDVQVGGSAQLLRHIPVVGGTSGLSAGDTVLLGEHDGQMYAYSQGVNIDSAGAAGGGGSVTYNIVDVHPNGDGEWTGYGDTIPLLWTPGNSTPDTSTPYANSPSHLTSILAGIDNKIGQVEGSFDAVLNAPIVTTEPVAAMTNEKVITSTSTINIEVGDSIVEPSVSLSETWSGLRDYNGLQVDRAAQFVWVNYHRFEDSVIFRGHDADIWFNKARSALYIGAERYPSEKATPFDAAVTIHPAYQGQTGLVIKRTEAPESYSGSLIRILDENNRDLIFLTSQGHLESGYPRFVTGSRGWRISSTGHAEFNSAYIRGELHASVFVVGEQHAMGGTFMILGASPLAKGFTSPGV